MKRLILVLMTAGLASGCATTPEPLTGEFSPVTLEEARSGEIAGPRVRWGGEIVETRPLDRQTCLEIMSRELGRSARPLDTDNTQGRFIACKDGFMDPAAFKAGREVTVAGELQGVDSGKIGEFEYRFPRVAADTVYLWPEREEYDDRYRYRPYFYDPFFWPYPYYYSYWHHPVGPRPLPKDGGNPGDS